ncbi:hypothetical protein C8T65DRAFT_125638 [Cerioporus squamosus]|nr:hypothetical protein C8T65DRAFT_125638 [Cerioporus squamosus]
MSWYSTRSSPTAAASDTATSYVLCKPSDVLASLSDQRAFKDRTEPLCRCPTARWATPHFRVNMHRPDRHSAPSVICRNARHVRTSICAHLRRYAGSTSADKIAMYSQHHSLPYRPRAHARAFPRGTAHLQVRSNQMLNSNLLRPQASASPSPLALPRPSARTSTTTMLERPSLAHNCVHVHGYLPTQRLCAQPGAGYTAVRMQYRGYTSAPGR